MENKDEILKNFLDGKMPSHGQLVALAISKGGSYECVALSVDALYKYLVILIIANM